MSLDALLVLKHRAGWIHYEYHKPEMHVLPASCAIDTILHFPYRIHGAAIYKVTWIPSIYPSPVSIYTSTMDPMGLPNYLPNYLAL